MTIFFLILHVALATTKSQTTVLENDAIQVKLTRIERPEAEPASKPYEIEMVVNCKTKKTAKTIHFPVCDFDPQDKENKISHTDITIAHFAWDGVKSSNNPDGRNYCDSKNKLYFKTTISDVCK